MGPRLKMSLLGVASLLAFLAGVSAEIRSVGTAQYMGCYKITSAAATFDLKTTACCDDGTTTGSNCVHCPECFLLGAAGSGTKYTLTGCPGYVNAATDYSGSTCDSSTPPNCEGHYVRQYQFINIAGAPQVVSDGETTTTSDISIASGTSATV